MFLCIEREVDSSTEEAEQSQQDRH